MFKIKLLNEKPFMGYKKTAHAKCNFYENEGLKLLVNGAVTEEMKDFLISRLPIVSDWNLAIKIWVSGGGLTSQKIAALKSIVRGAVSLDWIEKAKIKNDPYCWFDARKVERKKYGRKKARKGQQWLKR